MLARSPGSISYFDNDSLQIDKAKNVTIWVKTFRKRSADQYGVWSTATHWKILCRSKQWQITSMVQYGIDGEVLHSVNTATPPESTVPGTVSEDMLTMVCDPSFPNAHNYQMYARIYGDPLQFTQGIVAGEDQEDAQLATPSTSRVQAGVPSTLASDARAR